MTATIFGLLEGGVELVLLVLLVIFVTIGGLVEGFGEGGDVGGGSYVY